MLQPTKLINTHSKLLTLLIGQEDLPVNVSNFYIYLLKRKKTICFLEEKNRLRSIKNQDIDVWNIQCHLNILHLDKIHCCNG